jgi:hypothetical protein
MAEAVKQALQKVFPERTNPCVAVGHGYYKSLMGPKQMLNWGKDL